MAQTNPTYPPQNNAEAIELNVFNAKQFHQVLHGDTETVVPTFEGNANIPSVAKAISDSAAYKTPIAWSQGDVQLDLLQPRTFNNFVYVPITVPQTLGAQPMDSGWKLYLQNIDESSIDQGFNYYREVVSGSPKSLFTLPFMYETETIGNNTIANMFVTVEGEDIDLVDGVAYTSSNQITLATPVAVGETLQVRVETIATFSIVRGLTDTAETSAANAEASAQNAATSESNAADSASEAAASAANSVLFREELLDIKPSLKPVPNAGWGWSWGGEFSRAAYPEAWTEIQLQGSRFITESEWQTKSAAAGATGSVPYFSDGDGTTTFRVPRLADFHKGSLTVTASDRVLDSAPEISASLANAYREVSGGSSSATGAISVTAAATTNTAQGIGSTQGSTGFSFAASDSNAAYGRASEVAPVHWFAPWQIKLAGSVVNDGTIDASALQTQINTINGTTIPTAVEPKLGADNHVLFVDQRTSGSDGGTLSADTWTTRTLNSTYRNTITGVSLDVNTSRVTFPSGTYYFKISAPTYAVNQSIMVLQNITTNSIALVGTSEFNTITGDAQTRNFLTGYLTITETTVFEVRSRAVGTKTNNGLGVSVGITGVAEVYTQFEGWKVD